MTTTERASETLDTTWVFSTGQYWTSETILRHRSNAREMRRFAGLP